MVALRHRHTHIKTNRYIKRSLATLLSRAKVIIMQIDAWS